MKRVWMIPTTLTLLGTATPQALAYDITGNLDWSLFQVVLTDLDLSDGVTPNLTWSNPYTEVNVGVIPPGGVVAQGSADWTSPIGVNQGPASASASSSSLAVALTGMSSATDYAEGNAGRWGDFSITAHTSVQFTLPASVTVANLAGFDLSGGAYIETWDGVNLLYDSFYALSGESITRTLTLTFSNDTTNPLSAYFGAHLGFIAAPVPEPETWAMLLAGLGLVGWAARRRV